MSPQPEGSARARGAPMAHLLPSMGRSEESCAHFLRWSPAGLNSIAHRGTYLLMNAPSTAFLLSLFTHTPTHASWDHIPKTLCSPVLISESALGSPK